MARRDNTAGPEDLFKALLYYLMTGGMDPKGSSNGWVRWKHG